MGLIAWLVVGLIAGWLAGQVMKGGGYGLVGDIVVGAVGAVLGGFIASRLFAVADPINGINVQTIIVAFVGAMVLIWLVRMLPGRSPV